MHRLINQSCRLQNVERAECAHLHIQLVVQVFVNFLGIPVFLQESTEDPEAAHPEHLGGEAGLSGSPPLS